MHPKRIAAQISITFLFQKSNSSNKSWLRTDSAWFLPPKWDCSNYTTLRGEMQEGLKIFVLHGRKSVFHDKTVDISDNLFYTVFNVGADAHIGPQAAERALCVSGSRFINVPAGR